ncbi:HupU protein [Terasakiella sp. SH-1]|uniref:NADH-quinone oxidoreductase subunit B family protein n=1 Tax=Terasakiella sp. SH-1 TaxID=2560057 RepID=UPI0010746EDE|nr:HupU protein [Terasakiella sp. SH-1]
MSEMKNMLWLQSGGCGGCSLSLMCAESPNLYSALELANIRLVSHPSLNQASGRETVKILEDALSGELRIDIFCIEGSIMFGPHGSGRFHMASGFDNKPMKDLISELAHVSDYVMAVGSCAAFGGITAGGLNEAEARGMVFDGDIRGGLLGKNFLSRAGLPVINLSGCPIHPDWVMETLYQIAADSLSHSDLDSFYRPRFLSNRLVHHGCSRNEFYEFKASAQNLCEQGCLMENIGCKGTQAAGDCNIRPWNGSGSCITGGYPCIACTEPGFEEPGHAFLQTPKIAGIPVGLPTDMPKAWFVALASLAKAATPKRLSVNAVSEQITYAPKSKGKEE